MYIPAGAGVMSGYIPFTDDNLLLFIHPVSTIMSHPSELEICAYIDRNILYSYIYLCMSSNMK